MPQWVNWSCLWVLNPVTSLVLSVSLENILVDLNELDKGMELTKKELELRSRDRDPPLILKDFLNNSEDKMKKLKTDAKHAQVGGWTGKNDLTYMTALSWLFSFKLCIVYNGPLVQLLHFTKCDWLTLENKFVISESKQSFYIWWTCVAIGPFGQGCFRVALACQILHCYKSIVISSAYMQLYLRYWVQVIEHLHCTSLKQEAYAEVVEYFGENPKTLAPNTFFSLFVRFVRAFKVWIES